MKIYVASSWRCKLQPAVVAALRSLGHAVYDFRNPAPGQAGFAWREIGPDWMNWTPEQHVRALEHPLAVAGFKFDMDALRWCEACILVLPCGRSAHLELGWACGAGKRTYVLEIEPTEPDLMYAMCDEIFTSWDAMLRHFEIRGDQAPTGEDFPIAQRGS